MNIQITPAAVRKSIVVEAPVDRAFKVFAAIGGWWIKGHSIAASGQKDVILEPRAGGRWYEIGTNGEQCDWGRVVEWQPPHRMLLLWQISAEWKFDPDLVTELEVRFTKEGDRRTRVELEHRKLEAYGAATKAMIASFDSEGGWNGLLKAYSAAC
jgi:hypothetical protein